MNRRSMLVSAGLGLASLTAGCLFGERSTAQCHLMHEVVDNSENYGEPVETYRYEELSSEAQRVFEEAVAEGSYATTNQSLDSREFRYWDTTTVYHVTDQGETYVLLTYTGEGCENE